MSDTIHTLSTAGMTPKRQIQSWIDGLTSLCGHFDVDPLKINHPEKLLPAIRLRASVD